MEQIDREILTTVQDGIPLTRKPFKKISEKLGVAEDEVIARLQEMNKEGVIRRFSANINQRKLGITANAVVVWNIPDSKMEEALPVFLSYPEISHLYERVRYPGRWEYNLYSVVHGYSVESVKEFVEKIANKTGVNDYKVLFSKKRFKGTSSRLEKKETKK